MTLHTRLVLAFGALALLVVVGAASVALGFHSLGARIGILMEENFESVRASMEMLEAVERQNSAVLRALLDEQGARADIAESEATFFAALSDARANVTEETENPVLDRIESSFEGYKLARDRILASPVESPLAAYESQCFPHFEPVKSGVRELLDLNHKAMLEADARAQWAASRGALGAALVMALALMSVGLLSHRLRSDIIWRIEELRDVAEAVGRGDLRRRAAERRTDELGLVARELNGLLDAYEALRSEIALQERLSGELFGSLVGRLGVPSALFSSRGTLLASTLSREDSRRVRELVRIRSGREGAGEAQAPGVHEGREGRVSIELLRSESGRVTGYLASCGS